MAELQEVPRKEYVGTCDLQGGDRDPYTVKRVDEVVRHPHLVTQDQFTQVSKKV